MKEIGFYIANLAQEMLAVLTWIVLPTSPLSDYQTLLPPLKTSLNRLLNVCWNDASILTTMRLEYEFF